MGITAQNVLDLDKELGYKLLGAGAWDINFGFDDKRSEPFFKDLAAAWSGPTNAPTPAPPTPPTPPTPPPADCAAAWQQCDASGHPTCCQGTCTCDGAGTYKQCKSATGKYQC